MPGCRSVIRMEEKDLAELLEAKRNTDPLFDAARLQNLNRRPATSHGTPGSRTDNQRHPPDRPGLVEIFSDIP
ncbi:hypothetical protein KSP40_PGU019451 [Platanthera guangdongensis]|uniref:Uncharacterized protein n=1 Tax=Platanthera guangdongensis TaxID=2320717 RepID=A0ABR2MC61_9ASPA